MKIYVKRCSLENYFFLYYQTKKNFFRDFSSLQTYEIFSRPRRNPAFAETT